MEEKIIKDFERNPQQYRFITLEDIKNNLNYFDFNIIEITNGDKIRLFDGVVVTILHNDLNQPLVLHRDVLSHKKLEINPEWYLQNQESADEIIRYICKNIKKEKLTISNQELIDDKLIEAISQNNNIKEITLSAYRENGYFLTNEHYLKLKDSNITKVITKGVVKELEENFDEIIDFNINKYLISQYKYKDLIAGEQLYIREIIPDNDLPNLKYLNPKTTLYLTEEASFNLVKIIEELNKLGYQNKIKIKIDDKEKFNHYILRSNIVNDNIYVFVENMTLPLKEYLKFEQQLYKMVDEAKNLSPFEKYIYAYNKTKQFKEYKENKEDLNASRKLYSILENKFMVCVGFSEMFGDLLNKLGIANTDLSVTVDTSYDDVSRGKEAVEGVERVTEQAGHARRYVHINDDKYGIDGFYIADPTWDNDLENDCYNHLVVTSKEAADAKRYLWINKIGSEELLNIESIEEFYHKINFLLDRNILFYNRNLNETIKDFIKYQITPLDPFYIEKLKNKYSFISEDKWPENITDLIYDLGQYILNHVNKEIKGETIIEAVGNVYKKAYGYTEEEWQTKRDEIIYINKKRQEILFPLRYKFNTDGSQEIIANEKNKFDLSTNIKER